VNGRSSSSTGQSSTPSATDWVAALSPWPSDGFGTQRMRALLARLDDPQLRYPAIHVVGTNGKSTTTRMIEELLADAGLRRRVPLAARARLERADPRRRRGGRLRARRRACAS